MNPANDDRVIYLGVNWTKRKYECGHEQAVAYIAAAKRRLGKAGVEKLMEQWSIGSLEATLTTAEEKWPGVLNDIRTSSIRAVSSRHGMSRGSVEWIRNRAQALAEAQGVHRDTVLQRHAGRRARR